MLLQKRNKGGQHCANVICEDDICEDVICANVICEDVICEDVICEDVICEDVICEAHLLLTSWLKPCAHDESGHHALLHGRNRACVTYEAHHAP